MRKNQNNICRPDGTHTVMGALFLCFGASLPYLLMSGPRTPTQTDIYIISMIGVLCVLFGLAILFWSLSARYTWDARGLHWRSWGRWSHAAWKQIADYYISPVQGNRPQTLLVVETEAGTRRISTYLWTGHAELQAAIVDQSTAAQVKEWSVLGCRPGDTPRTFGYSLMDRLGTLAAGLVILGSLTFSLVWICIKASKTITLIGLWMGIAQCTITVLLIGVYGTLWMLPMILRFRAFRRRETFITTDAGITYQNGEGVITASWEEVRAWSYVNLGKVWEIPAFCEVITDRGTFSFALAIRDRTALIAILQEKTGEAFQSKAPNEILRIDPAEYGIVREGRNMQRLYHYKTRTNRAMVMGLLVFAAVSAPALEINRWVTGGQPLPAPLHVAIYASVIVVIGYVWMWYQRCGVITDDDAIVQLSPRYRRSIAWRDLSECRYDNNALMLRLRGNRAQINIPFCISDVDDLIAEIQARAPEAQLINMDRRSGKLPPKS